MSASPLTWLVDETFTAHASTNYSYLITHQNGGKYVTWALERRSSVPDYTAVGEFDTLAEGKAACETNFRSQPPDKQS